MKKHEQQAIIIKEICSHLPLIDIEYLKRMSADIMHHANEERIEATKVFADSRHIPDDPNVYNNASTALIGHLLKLICDLKETDLAIKQANKDFMKVINERYIEVT